jgi:hypothetical protein
VPTDALDGEVPAELMTLSDGALEVFDAAGSVDWPAASATIRHMEAAWQAYRGGDVPRLIEPLMEQALSALAGAVRARKATEARDAAIQAARSSLDLQLPYRPQAEIDLARMDLWAAQLLVDEAAGDVAGVGADQFAMDYDRDRIRDAVSARDLTRIDTEIGAIQIAVAERDLPAAAAAAERLRRMLAGIRPTS